MDGEWRTDEGYVTRVTACGYVRVVSQFTAVSSELFDVLAWGHAALRKKA